VGAEEVADAEVAGVADAEVEADDRPWDMSAEAADGPRAEDNERPGHKLHDRKRHDRRLRDPTPIGHRWGKPRDRMLQRDLAWHRDRQAAALIHPGAAGRMFHGRQHVPVDRPWRIDHRCALPATSDQSAGHHCPVAVSPAAIALVQESGPAATDPALAIVPRSATDRVLVIDRVQAEFGPVLATGQAWRGWIDHRNCPATQIDRELAATTDRAAASDPVAAAREIDFPAAIDPAAGTVLVQAATDRASVLGRVAAARANAFPASIDRATAIDLAAQEAAIVRSSVAAAIDPADQTGPAMATSTSATTSTSGIVLAAATSLATVRHGTMATGTIQGGVGVAAAGPATGTTTASAQATVGTTVAGMAAIGEAIGTHR